MVRFVVELIVPDDLHGIEHVAPSWLADETNQPSNVARLDPTERARAPQQSFAVDFPSLACVIEKVSKNLNNWKNGGSGGQWKLIARITGLQRSKELTLADGIVGSEASQ